MIDLNVEKLLVFILLDDGIAKLLSNRAGPAYFRAFILENRTTGEVSIRFRYRYTDESQWYRATCKKTGAEAIEFFESGMRYVLDEAARILGVDMPPGAVVSFYAPPNLDGPSTALWMEQQDLVTIRFEPVNAGLPAADAAAADAAATPETPGGDPCTHTRLDEDGICRQCGKDRRGI